MGQRKEVKYYLVYYFFINFFIRKCVNAQKSIKDEINVLNKDEKC